MQHFDAQRRALMLGALAFAANASAQPAYPSKLIRLVVPFPPGGTSDLVGRLFASGLSKRLKQPVIVENKPGGGTVIGTDHVAKSAPDGYTLLLGIPGLAINPAVRKDSLPYNTERDLEAVCDVVEMPMVVYASVESGFKSLADVIAAAKKDPGTVTYGSAGENSTGYFSMRLLEQACGVRLLHVPFQGSAASMNALLGGHLQLNCDTSYLGAPYVSTGKIVGIATLAPSRSSLIPNVPTAVEVGVQVESAAWWTIFARRGTPPAVSEQINAALRSTLQDPEVRQTLEKDGFTLTGRTIAESQARFKAELAKMAAAVRG